MAIARQSKQRTVQRRSFRYHRQRVIPRGGFWYSSLRLNGTVSNGASTPDHATFTPTTSLSVRMALSADDWTPGVTKVPLAHFGLAGQQGWEVFVGAAGNIGFILSTTGSDALVFQSTVANAFPDGSLRAIRLDWTASPLEVKIFHKTTTPRTCRADLASDTGWTQLGATVPATGAASIFNSNAALYVGAVSTGSFPWSGKILAARVLTDGVLRAEPYFTLEDDSRSFTDSTGKVWTLQGSAWRWAPAPLT